MDCVDCVDCKDRSGLGGLDDWTGLEEADTFMAVVL